MTYRARHFRCNWATAGLCGVLAVVFQIMSGTAFGQSVSIPAREFSPGGIIEIVWAPGQRDDVNAYEWKLCVVKVSVIDFEEKRAPVISADCQAVSGVGGQDGMKNARYSPRISRPDLHFQHYIAAVGYADQGSGEFAVMEFGFFTVRARPIAYIGGLIQIPTESEFREGEPMLFSIDESKRLALEPIHENRRDDQVRIYRMPVARGEAFTAGAYVGRTAVADSRSMYMHPLPSGKYQLHYVRAGWFVIDRVDFEVLPFALRKPLEVNTDVPGAIEVSVPRPICSVRSIDDGRVVLMRTENGRPRVVDELRHSMPVGRAGSCSDAKAIRRAEEDRDWRSLYERKTFKNQNSGRDFDFQAGDYEVLLVLSGKILGRKSFVIADPGPSLPWSTAVPRLFVQVWPAALPATPLPVEVSLPMEYQRDGATYALVLERIEETEYSFQMGATIERVESWPLVPGVVHKFAPSVPAGNYKFFVEEISEDSTRQIFRNYYGDVVERVFRVHEPSATARLEIASGPHFRNRIAKVNFSVDGQNTSNTIPQYYDADIHATCSWGWPSTFRFNMDNQSHLRLDLPVGTYEVGLGYVYSHDERSWLIGSTPLEIVEPSATLTLLSPQELPIGEPAAVSLEVKGDAARELHYDIQFFRSGFVAPGGALVYSGFPFIASSDVTSPEQHKRIEARLPNMVGDYRANLIYEGVVIDHLEFRVVDPDNPTAAGLVAAAFSDTPSFFSPLVAPPSRPERLNLNCGRTPGGIQPVEQIAEIENFYPVKNEVVFAFIGSVDVTRPDSSDPGDLWQGMLPREEAEKYGADHRLLFIQGENIFDILDGDPVIKGIDSNMQYEILDIEPRDWADLIDSDYYQAWTDYDYSKTLLMNNEDKQTFRDMEKYLVAVKLPAGKTGGIERFHINGIEAKWILLKGNVTADISIIREQDPADQKGPSREFPDALDYFFSGDRIAVEVRLSNEVELDEVSVVLQVDNKIIKIDDDIEMAALPVPGVPGLYRTAVMTRVELDGSGPVAAGAKRLPIGKGSVLSVILPHAAPVTMRSPGAAMYHSTPNGIGNHWLSRARQVAWLAGKLDLYNADPVAFLREKVSEVAFTHVTGSDTIDITAGDHAALLILRQSFIDQMKPVYKELSELDEQLGDDPFLLNSFYQMAKRQIDNPYHPYQYIEVDAPQEIAFTTSVSYRNALDDEFLDSTFFRYWDRVNWVNKATRQALDEYLAATKFAIEHAESIEDNDFEALLKLVSVGFGGVAQKTVPNIVKLSTSAPLRWVPNRLARGYVASVNNMGKRYRANKELTRAEVNIAIAAATVVVFAPVAVPLQAMAAGVSVVLAGEYFAYERPEAVASRVEAKLALGAVTLLGPDRVDLALSQRVSPGMEALIVLGTIAGLGGDFVALVHSVRVSRALVAGTRGLDLMETGGFQTFARLTEREQIAVAVLMQEARNVNMVDPSQLTGLQRRALNASRRIGDGAEHIRELRLYDRLFAGGHKTGKEYKFWPRQEKHNPPPTLKNGSVFVGMTVGRELGVGSNARVYEIIGPDSKVINDRVLKIFRTGERGDEAIENSLYVADLLDSRGITQLKILGSGTENGMPFLVQERLSKSQRTYEVIFQSEKITDIDGLSFKGDYWGLKEFSRLNPDDSSKLLLRKLPRPLQRAYFRLLGQINDSSSGRVALIWEDSHLENVYFDRLGPNEWRAGILDQDRVMPWAEKLAPDHPMYLIQNGQVKMAQLRPTSFNIFSMANAKAPRGDPSLAVPIIDATGAFYPSARFFQAKWLEVKGLVVYEPATNTWKSRTVDMDIVEEFFPHLRDWANFDFDAYYPARQ